MLIDSGDPDHSPIHFCVRHIGPQRPALSLRGNSTVTVGRDGCTTSPPIQLEIIVADRDHFSCEPAFITPQRRVTEPLAIDCDVRLAGTWHSSAGDLFITQTDRDRWTASGLGSSSLGAISGELQGFAHSSLFSGTTALGGPLTGTLEAQPRRGILKVQSIDGATQTVELIR
jgi:hypothetical protein